MRNIIIYFSCIVFLNFLIPFPIMGDEQHLEVQDDLWRETRETGRKTESVAKEENFFAGRKEGKNMINKSDTKKNSNAKEERKIKGSNEEKKSDTQKISSTKKERQIQKKQKEEKILN
eukprot:TRINITY_DN3215_c0_g2_i1.p1 TRINITY_DN3215_c0_g2~~TRINITY_DN3215_c0_g2_i1.p1  ORF type:complete len:118 (+),score=30.55 TRINITY_DN3215_c0_g2_i1:137-490(+)